MRMRPLPLVLGLASILSACNLAPLDAADFADAYAQAACEQSARCNALAPFLQDLCQRRSHDAIGPDVLDAVEAGRITYDPGKARDCVEGVRQTRCLADELSDTTLKACLDALKGNTPTGTTCHSLFECQAGLCGGTPSTTCPTSCPQVAPEGQACSLIFGPDCDIRLGLRCAGGVCVKPQGSGTACTDNYGCQSDLVCVGGKCVGRRAPGQGCSSDASCQDGNWCAGGDEGGKCEARSHLGDPCAVDDDEIDAALRGSICDDGLVCQGAGLNAVGGHSAGTCATPAAIGEPCTPEPDGFQVFASGCQTGLVCEPVNGHSLCVMPPTSGVCAPHYTCREGVSYCNSGNQCVPLKPNGASCQIDLECASGYCPGTSCEDRVKYCHT